MDSYIHVDTYRHTYRHNTFVHTYRDVDVDITVLKLNNDAHQYYWAEVSTKQNLGVLATSSIVGSGRWPT